MPAKPARGWKPKEQCRPFQGTASRTTKCSHLLFSVDLAGHVCFALRCADTSRKRQKGQCRLALLLLLLLPGLHNCSDRVDNMRSRVFSPLDLTHAQEWYSLLNTDAQIELSTQHYSWR